MFTFLTSLASSIASSIAANLLYDTATSKLSSGKILPKRTALGYLFDLEQKIREMPFIYQDLDGEVLNDFVDVEFQSLTLDSLRHKHPDDQRQRNPYTIDINDDEKLRRNQKVLFLGNAGIGKTTFQRQRILTLIRMRSAFVRRNDKIKFVNEKEKPLPIYIPLKAVDNSSPLPILRYMLDNIPLFTHARGLKRMIRLAKSRSLFLFLDGYDEIPFTGDNHNFVQDELEHILFPLPSGLHQVWGLQNPEHRQFYESLEGCRVWLSSRKEFFIENPVGKLGTGHIKEADGLVSVELKGIGNNRYKLAQKIFNKYRERSQVFREILSEEYFLNDIDRLKDEDLKKFSFNPLFLTVMCYVYVQKAQEKNTCKVTWVSNFEELILECINLLLFRLDEVKSRDLPKASQIALLDRRDQYKEDKTLFLQYFASQLFFEGKSIFTGDYIKAKVREFFTNENPGPASAEIIESLSDAHHKSFAQQLIYQGVFVMVDKGNKGVLYDFPHRRFREVLASSYIANPERYEKLLANIERKQFSEFLSVFFNSRGFRDKGFQDRSLSHILNKSKGAADGKYFERLSYHFMVNKPGDYDPNRELQRFMESCLETDAFFNLSTEVLNHFKPEPGFQEKLPALFRESVAEARPYRLALCAALLEFFNRPLLVELLRNTLADPPSSQLVLLTLLQYALRNEFELALSLPRGGLNNTELFQHLCYAIVSHFRGVKEWSPADGEMLGVIFSHLDRNQRIVLTFFFYNYNSDLFARVLRSFMPESHRALFEYANAAGVGRGGDLTQLGDEYNYRAIADETVAKLYEEIDRYTMTKPRSGVASAGRQKGVRQEEPPEGLKEFKEEMLKGMDKIKYEAFAEREFVKRIGLIIKYAADKQAEKIGKNDERMLYGQPPAAVAISVKDFQLRVEEIILKNSLYSCILTDSAVSEIAVSLRQRLPLVLSTIIDQRVAYAVVENTDELLEEIGKGIRPMMYQLQPLEVFKTRANEIVISAVKTLGRKVKFKPTYSLPTPVHQSRVMNREDLQKELLELLLKKTLFPTPLILETQAAVKDLTYTPTHLTRFFS